MSDSKGSVFFKSVLVVIFAAALIIIGTRDIERDFWKKGSKSGTKAAELVRALKEDTGIRARFSDSSWGQWFKGFSRGGKKGARERSRGKIDWFNGASLSGGLQRLKSSLMRGKSSGSGGSDELDRHDRAQLKDLIEQVD